MNKFYSVVSALLLLSAGCSKETSSPSAPPAAKAPSAPASGGPAIVSAEKNSFQDVTAHLDPGGNVYAYLSTEQLMTGLSQSVSEWKKVLGAMPELRDEQTELMLTIDVIARIIKNSGMEQISGLGMSSIAREKGLYQSKLMVHHYKGNQSGYLWSIAGRSPHALDGLDMLPASTAFAGFGDFDVAQLWDVISKEVDQSGSADFTKKLHEVPAEFEKDTGMNFKKTLDSLGGEYGFVVTLDAGHKVQFPGPGGKTIEFPEPGIVIVVKVKNDLIYNRAMQAMKEMPQVVTSDQDGVKMCVMPMPVPIPVKLQPTLALSGEYLFIASSDSLVREMLAAKKGTGLKGTPDFKKLAANVPDKGNNFVYVNPLFGETISQLQRAFMPQDAGSAEVNSAMAKFFTGGAAATVFSVSQNTDEGWLMTGNGTQSPTMLLAGPALVAPVGLMAAIAIPNFVKARETAQKNACRANLKMLDGAMQQWALENRKKSTDRADLKQLAPYLQKGIPVCPAGGVYSVTTVSEPPTCSHAGHSID